MILREGVILTMTVTVTMIGMRTMILKRTMRSRKMSALLGGVVRLVGLSVLNLAPILAA
jgi:hypothetical protein